MKAILVINVSDKLLAKHPLEDIEVGYILKYAGGLFAQAPYENTRGLLRPLPEKKKPENPDETWDEMHERWGYNKCLDEITGETE